MELFAGLFGVISPFLYLIGAAWGIKIVMAFVIKGKIKNRIDTLKDFSTNQYFISPNGYGGIAVDTDRKKICLLKYVIGKNPDADKNLSRIERSIISTVIDYADLLSCQILENGTTITNTSRTGQAGSALLGGALFGGVGAVVGALTSSSSSHDILKSADLKIIINSIKYPTWEINFFTPNFFFAPLYKKGSDFYKDAMKTVSHWDGLIAAFIKQADAQDNKPSDSSLSIADEITKLSELRNNGILSEAEFTKQKKKLLNV